MVLNPENKISVVLEDLSASQLNYLAISSANSLSSKNYQVNVNIFCLEHSTPCLPLVVPRFNTADTVGFDGTMVLTSLKTVFDTQQATRCQKIVYINDIEFERPWGQSYLTPEVLDVLKDDRVIKISRSEDYRPKCKNLGIKIDMIMPIFDLKGVFDAKA